MNLQILVFSLLIMFVKTQEILGSGTDYTDQTTISIFNNSETTNIITIIPNNNTILPTINNSTSCLTVWQKVQILFNFASFDVNQYLSCLTNTARFTQQNNIFTIIALLIAILMNN